jgi:hypothetical protein
MSLSDAFRLKLEHTGGDLERALEAANYISGVLGIAVEFVFNQQKILVGAGRAIVVEFFGSTVLHQLGWNRDPGPAIPWGRSAWRPFGEHQSMWRAYFKEQGVSEKCAICDRMGVPTGRRGDCPGLDGCPKIAENMPEATI